MSNIGEELARLEQEDLDYTKERKLKKEYETKIKNLKINARNKMIIAFLAGVGVATVLCNGKEIVGYVQNTINTFIEQDNKKLEEEGQDYLENVSNLTGRPIDELLDEFEEEKNKTY